LAGLVERVTFHSAETGFCVLRVKVRSHRELVTVLGPSEGLSVHMSVARVEALARTRISLRCGRRARYAACPARSQHGGQWTFHPLPLLERAKRGLAHSVHVARGRPFFMNVILFALYCVRPTRYRLPRREQPAGAAASALTRCVVERAD
jgi:hypothetical protein